MVVIHRRVSIAPFFSAMKKRLIFINSTNRKNQEGLNLKPGLI